MKIAAIILAAGPSKRLGFPKQLVKLDGVSMVRKVALSLCEAGIDNIGVVTGAWHSQLEKELAGLNVEVVQNENWRSGFSSSVACGATWAESLSDITHTMFIATDQWMVSKSDIEAIVQEFEKDSCDIVGASFAGSWGMPLMVGNAGILSSLTKLSPDSRFIPFLESVSDEIVSIPMEHASKDLDTPAQLMELSESFDVTVMRPGAMGAI